MGIPVTNSIVRELVPRSSSGAVDESASLSASDLIAILENIRARSEEIKEKVHKTVTNYNTDFFRIIAQSSQTVVNVENVSKELKNVLELLGEKTVKAEVCQDGRRISLNGSSPREIVAEKKKPFAEYNIGSKDSVRKPVDLEICHLAEEVQRLRSKVKEREEALVVVETISSLYDLLLATETKFVPNNLVEAAKGMVMLQEKLGIQVENEEPVTEDQDHDVRAFKLLQDAWSDRLSKLLALLEDLFSKAIVLDERKSELAVTTYNGREMLEVEADGCDVELSSIFTAMDVLGVLDVRLARLGDSIVRHIMGPLLNNSQTVISTPVLPSGAKALSRSVLTWTSENESGKPVPEVLYPKIVQVIKFINNHIFGNHAGQIGRFGRVVWPRLAEAIISSCLSKAVPNETSQLKDFENIAELTANFEKELASEGFIANFDQARGDKLSTFASDVEVHFALKKKKHVLAKARDLLMQSDYSLSKSIWKSFNDGDIGKDLDQSIYLFPDPCAISFLARSLLGIVHEAIEDACLSTPRTALELYHASRDVILMYRAIIPIKLAGNLNRMQIDALCHNDCLYIAHELLTFVYQYREELPPCLKQVFTFVDLVPMFRRMALEFLEQQIKVVQSEVMQGLDHADGFQYTDKPKQFQLAQQALEEVFDTFATVGGILRPVLAQGIYTKVIGNLINSVVQRIVHEVLAINDIAVQETLQLQKLLCIVQEGLPPFLNPEAVDISEKYQVAEKKPTENLVPLWAKLEKLINLLDMSLVSINQAWEAGELLSSGFSPSEVQKLIRAIFSETALREECLRRIGSSS